jgi:hypothetical protein
MLCCSPVTLSKVIGCLDRTASVIAAAGLPVVLLPGNHDPAIPEAVFRRGSLAGVDNLMVLGVTHPEAVDLPHLDLEIWGRAHRDYGDMVPLETVRPRRTRWQIAAAHGHYDPSVDRSVAPRPSWLINDEEITATGNGPVAAYYSGSPEYAGTVNVVRLTHDGQVLVERMELDIPREVEPVYVP